MRTVKPGTPLSPQDRHNVVVSDIEFVYGRKFTEKEWAEFEALDTLANRLADRICAQINKDVLKVRGSLIKYKAQHTLEELVKKLSARI